MCVSAVCLGYGVQGHIVQDRCGHDVGCGQADRRGEVPRAVNRERLAAGRPFSCQRVFLDEASERQETGHANAEQSQ